MSINNKEKDMGELKRILKENLKGFQEGTARLRGSNSQIIITSKDGCIYGTIVSGYQLDTAFWAFRNLPAEDKIELFEAILQSIKDYEQFKLANTTKKIDYTGKDSLNYQLKDTFEY